MGRSDDDKKNDAEQTRRIDLLRGALKRGDKDFLEPDENDPSDTKPPETSKD